MNPLGTGDPLRLGPYRLLGVLGEGGMGKVYFGQDAEGNKAAVKVLRPELTQDQHLAQRFVREAEMAQAVVSPGVARVLGAQTEGGRPWIATEFLTGPTLDEAVESYGALDEPAVRALAAGIAGTLTDIHALGLVHRDLKPANIVLTSTGPRVIDFGIARPEHGLTLTTTGQIPITPGYGAPEQVLGQRVGAPADVFSLGAVLVYAATGARAFDGGHVAAVQYEVVHGEPELGHVPEELRSLIAPCLGKEPAFRPTPDQITHAFAPPRGAERIWRHGPLAQDIKKRERTVQQLTTVVSGPGSGRPLSRRRLITTFAVGGTVLAAGGGTAAWWLRGRKEDDPFALPPAAKTPQARVVAAAGGKPPAPLWQTREAFTEKSPGPLAVRDVVIAGPKGGGIAAYDVVDGKRRWQAKDIDMTAGYLSLSDALIAAIDTKGTLRTYVASSGEPRWTAPAEARSLVAADDNAVYVATRSGRLRSISRYTGKIVWTVKTTIDLDSQGGKQRPVGAAARDRLVVATHAGDVVAFDSGTGEQKWKFSGQETIDETVLVPVIEGNVVYINGRVLTARNLADGNEHWATGKITEGKLRAAGPPIIRGRSIYVTEGLNIDAYRLKGGDAEWESSQANFTYSPLAFQGDTVCAMSSGDSGFQLWAFSHDSGKKVWTYPLVKDAGRYWVVGDGNRLFVRNGTELLALPVF
ncbi:protein kinase domain-containing protein [Streptomyces sp. NBC_01304]|uniref:protein kinase domain-containing protein n=1 Tax=Streptomyces sp. NBC_01304 TaxID=2903818 RepID=UPI002E159057|nr:PQQ-binding-like beta-propeller repeat protein [Streptomyces sp. NBC_01304]